MRKVRASSLTWRWRFTADACVLAGAVALCGCAGTPYTPSVEAAASPSRAGAVADIRPPPSGGSTLAVVKSAQASNDDTGPDWAYFGIGTEDCRGRDGVWRVHVVEFHVDSEAQRRGLKIGDVIVRLGAHKPMTSGELTMVIRRLTPNMLYDIEFTRPGVGTRTIQVIPPARVPRDASRAITPRPAERKRCSSLELGVTSRS
jgi:hypothetical protein